MPTSTYYQVSALMKEMRASADTGRRIMVEDGSEAWIMLNQGFVQWTSWRDHAARFPDRESALAAFVKSDGMPWFFRPKSETALLHRVVEETVVTHDAEAIPVLTDFRPTYETD